jgi:thioredoxin-like negative regulator of GroEL
MLERKQTQRLLDIALLGCQTGHTTLARDVIEGLDQLLEKSAELEICRAMGYYTVDQFDEAKEILGAALERFPDDQMVKTHTALVDILMGETIDAKKNLDQVAAQNKDADAQKFAATLIEQYY